VLSVVGLVLWYLTKIGNIAILFSILSDFLAGIPTLKKSFYHPESENYLEFMSSFISVTLAMFTLDTWSFEHVAFPLYIFLFDLAIVILLKFKLGPMIKSVYQRR